MRIFLSMRVRVGVVHCFSKERYTGWALVKTFPPPTLLPSLPPSLLTYRMWCMRILLSMRVKVGVVHCFSKER